MTSLKKQKSLMNKNEIRKMRRYGYIASMDSTSTGKDSFADVIKRALEASLKEEG